MGSVRGAGGRGRAIVSRAFVKEPDGEAVGDDAPELPVSPHPNRVTPRGLALLRAEMEALGLRSTPRGTVPKNKFDAVRFLSGLAVPAFRATGLYSRGVRNLLSLRLRMLAVRLSGLPEIGRAHV